MPDIPPYPDDSEDRAASRDRPSRASTARPVYLWVAGIGLVLLFVVLHLTGVLGPGGH